MHLEIRGEYENPLMERTEVEFFISGVEATPSRKEVRKKIASMKNAKEELVVIEFLKQPFGSHTVNGRVRIYKSGKRLKRVESGFLPERGTKKKKEEAPANAPAPGGEEAGEKPAEKKEKKPAGESEEKPAENTGEKKE